MPNLRAWLLRRLARRLRIGEDILSHLSSFQRLGEQLEIASPQEMLPVGARTVIRALRSRAAPEIRPDWLWPYWLERQHDPTSPHSSRGRRVALARRSLPVRPAPLLEADRRCAARPLSSSCSPPS